jgi:peptidoglycan/LPS O-acetylase OafA/YrhL
MNKRETLKESSTMHINLLSNLKTSDISQYRQTLMGVAIVGVLFSHWFGFQSINSGVPFVLSTIVVRLVFTEGFLFLSGFGLYYSFSRNNDSLSFYKRRLIRLYIPFLLLSFPLYSFFLITREGYGIMDYLTQLTTSYFWFHGNYGGMWYVSLSIMLYLLFPLLFYFLFSKSSTKSVYLRFILCLGLFYLIVVPLKSLNYDYYSLIKIGIEKIPFFIVGILLAFVVKNELLTHITYRLCFFLMGGAYLFFTIINHYLPGYWIQHFAGFFQKLFFMPLLCLLFNSVVKFNLGQYLISILNWFGKYSLELYILHLHFYMFFRYSIFNTLLSPMLKASIAIVLAIILCQPVNRMISQITKKRN